MRCVKTSRGNVAAPPERGRVDRGTTRRPTQKREKVQMDAENVVGLLIALALLGYLVVALIRPEKF
ncbi:hypothetical protein Snoj_40310 [Streptomyces nojiriensis]|uniref:K(+)-transporting ATPase subunit F n=1 Tax=Streptomyces nojiriensis TaxID=66374 RepID=A0ABQ3SPP6_9ACTN|nr:hypothetical protein JYK04_01412 [Streptomyces nojiriensis]GGR82561.1 hypothetical protein GCM10010205_08960 [Streptomyces nojiriensis]GHI70113.1 hypothetical protein Snoj_40310 [Streptomyces nojiriensis]